MKEEIGYCGYNCHLCAAKSDDEQLRKKLVDGWKKIFGHQNYTAENVKCVGCKNEGKVADQQCKARPCAISKQIESCADCEEFPCDKMKNLMGSKEGMLIFGLPNTSSITLEEYNLCVRQFESMPNLLKKLAENGKIEKTIHNRSN